MNINHLLEFLEKWTNYRQMNIFGSPLEFYLKIDYLKNNDSRNFLNLFMHDNETRELMKTERLVHPVILAQEIQRILIEINHDVKELSLNEYGHVGQIFDDFCLVGSLL